MTYYASMFVLGATSLSWTNFPSIYERLQYKLEIKAMVSQERDHQNLDNILSTFHNITLLFKVIYFKNCQNVCVTNNFENMYHWGNVRLG